MIKMSLKRSIILCLGVLIITVLFFFSCNKNGYISDNAIPYTSEELTEVFQKNQNEFKEVSEILLSNDLFYENGKPEGRSSARIAFFNDKLKEYFTSEDWGKICKFFNTIKPVDITRYNNFVIGFHFAQTEDKVGSTIYYFTDNTDFIYHKQKYNYFKELIENWYIGER